MLSTSETPLAPMPLDLASRSAAEHASIEVALAALKQACGDHYKAPEIISFPINGPTLLDAMAVTGNF